MAKSKSNPNYNNQFENTIFNYIDPGTAMVLAVAVGQEMESEDKPSYLYDVEGELAKKLKAGCIQGRYTTNHPLLTLEEKGKILDYIMEYHIDFEMMAEKVLEEMKKVLV